MSGSTKQLLEHPTADAVHRRVDHRHVGADRRRTTGVHLFPILIEDVVGHRGDQRRPSSECRLDTRHLSCWSGEVDRGGDVTVNRGDYLRGVVRIHLVPIVGRRIMRRRNDDSGCRPELLGGKRHQRRGCKVGKEDDGDTHGREDARGVLRKLFACRSCIEPHHDGALRHTVVLVDQVAGQTTRCSDDHSPVHAVGACADLPSYPGGPERE